MLLLMSWDFPHSCRIISSSASFLLHWWSTMATEPGEPQLSSLEAAALSSPKQVKWKDKVKFKAVLKGWIFTSCLQNKDGGMSQTSFNEDSTSHLSSGVRITRSPARNPLSFRMMQAKVTLLDASLFTCTVEVRQAESGEVRHMNTDETEVRRMQTGGMVAGETGWKTQLSLQRLKPAMFL